MKFAEVIPLLHALGRNDISAAITKERLDWMRTVISQDERIAELEADLIRRVKEMEEEVVRVECYRKGWERGVKNYAIWCDGGQLVGCRQTPLPEVLAKGPDVDLERFDLHELEAR